MDFLNADAPSIAAAGFFVVTADLTAAAVYKTGGALMHKKHGQPNMELAKWLILGSVPMAFIGPFALRRVIDPADVETVLKMAIGFALLLAASTYAVRLYLQLRAIRRGTLNASREPVIRPIPTVLVGALGGALVGITSVGSGSVIMVALLMLYPGLSAVRLVGTDLVQAVPLVLSAAVANIIATNGLDWGLTLPLILGSVPGTLIGSRIAPKVPQSIIRRGIVIVLTMSGVALLDKAGWAPLGAGEDDTHPILIAGIGLALVVLVPLVWGLLRRSEGLSYFGAPSVEDIEEGRARYQRQQAAAGSGRK